MLSHSLLEHHSYNQKPIRLDDVGTIFRCKWLSAFSRNETGGQKFTPTSISLCSMLRERMERRGDAHVCTHKHTHHRKSLFPCMFNELHYPQSWSHSRTHTFGSLISESRTCPLSHVHIFLHMCSHIHTPHSTGTRATKLEPLFKPPLMALLYALDHKHCSCAEMIHTLQNTTLLVTEMWFLGKESQISYFMQSSDQ